MWHLWQQHVAFMNAAFGQGWQDYVIVALQLGFSMALLPMFAKNAHRPELSSSLTTAVFVTVFVYVYATLGFWRTVIFTSVLGIEWWIIAYLGPNSRK